MGNEKPFKIADSKELGLGMKVHEVLYNGKHFGKLQGLLIDAQGIVDQNNEAYRLGRASRDALRYELSNIVECLQRIELPCFNARELLKEDANRETSDR